MLEINDYQSSGRFVNSYVPLEEGIREGRSRFPASVALPSSLCDKAQTHVHAPFADQSASRIASVLPLCTFNLNGECYKNRYYPK